MGMGGLVDGNTAILSVSPDGAVDWPRSLRLAAAMYADGVHGVVVTSPPESIDVMQRRVPQYSAQLSQHGVSMQITMAVELTMQLDLLEWAQRLARIGIGPCKRYVYLRVADDNVLPVGMVVRRLVDMNLVPILLAPERCRQFRGQIREVKKLVADGALVQISAASLIDRTDPARIRFCRRLIRQQLCHMVASESGRHHDLPISIREAFELIERWSGKEMARQLCGSNPSQIFSGQPLELKPTHVSVWPFRRAA